MEEKKRFKVYRIVMLLVLAVFITFLITSIGMYQYFSNGKIGKELVISSETDLSNIKNEISDTQDVSITSIKKYGKYKDTLIDKDVLEYIRNNKLYM